MKLSKIITFDYDGYCETKIELEEFFRRICKSIFTLSTNKKIIKDFNIMSDSFYLKFNDYVIKFKLKTTKKYNSIYDIIDTRVIIFDRFELSIMNNNFGIIDSEIIHFNDIYGRVIPSLSIEYDHHIIENGEDEKSEIKFLKHRSVHTYTDCLLIKYPLYEESKISTNSSLCSVVLEEENTNKILFERFFMSFNSASNMLYFDKTIEKITNYIINYIKIFIKI